MLAPGDGHEQVNALPFADATGHVLVYRRDSGAAEVVLNRPERLNALNPGLLDELSPVLQGLAADVSVRAVLLRGNGRAFCAGGDLRVAAEKPGPIARDARVTRLRRWARAAEVLRVMPKPTIAAVRGPAVGAGLGLALACDLRVAAPSATFAAGYVKVGLSGDFGTAWSLTVLMGGSRARSMLLTGEPLAAIDAHQAGLVWRLVPEDELVGAAHAAVDALANGPIDAFAAMKANVAQAEGEPDWESEARRHETARDSADHAEGLAAFRQRRSPAFRQGRA